MSNEIMSLPGLIEFYLTWLSNVSEKLASVILLIGFAVLVALEFNYPKRNLPNKYVRRSYQTNLGLFIVNNLFICLFSVMPLLALAERYAGHGLLNYVPDPVGKALLAFVLYDLLHYFWHRASHTFDGLWMFHKIHHNDPYLNVSTAVRLHIVELLILTACKSFYIVMFGVEQITVLISETVLTLFVMFHHANLSFSGEKQLSRVFITPFLHRAHHSIERAEHDNNYGAVFSVWDRLFGTYLECEPRSIGLKYESPQTLFGLLKFGFTLPQPVRSTVFEPEANLKSMIAEAAYYKAEKRAFAPGHELHDWLEAKREIFTMLNGDNMPGKGRDGGDFNSRQRPLNLCG